MAIIAQIVFDRTTFGFELKAVGLNKTCARYFGVGVGRSVVYCPWRFPVCLPAWQA